MPCFAERHSWRCSRTNPRSRSNIRRAALDDLIEFYKRLPNPDKQFIMMSGISHASFQQKNYLMVYQILHAFFTQQAPAYTASH